MDQHPVVPQEHPLPYCHDDLFAPGFQEPTARWIACGLIYGMIVLISLLVLVSNGALWFLAFVVGGIPLTLLFMRTIDHIRRFADPKAAKLGETEDGRALLSEGQRLHDQRTKMREGSAGPHPLLEAFYVPESVDETSEQVIRRREEVNKRFWDYHTALERTLRDRQERHLRGEKVAIVGRLSDRTP